MSDLEFEIEGTKISLQLGIETLAHRIRTTLDAVDKTIAKGDALLLNELGELQSAATQYDIKVAQLAMLESLSKNRSK